MKNIGILIFVVMSSCSFVPNSPTDLLSSQKVGGTHSIEEMNRMYPYLNTVLRPFEVQDKNSPVYGATELDNMRARQIDATEKYNMLRRVDFMRFVVNTPEFETNLLKGKFRSARTAKGVYGSIKVGDYYDNNRILVLLQSLIINTRIGKQPLSAAAAAVGLLGKPLYVTANSQNSMVEQMGYGAFIIFPNRDYWGVGGYNNDNFPSNIYISSLIFHELLHNMGFAHEETLHGQDTVYGIQNVFVQTAQDPVWQKKYQRSLKVYQYVQTKHKDWLTFTTTPTRINVRQGAKRTDESYNKNDIELGVSEEQIEVCILNLDGSYTIKTTTKRKMLNGLI